MKIYHFPFSANARKVLITAYQLGLSPELVLVDLPKGGHRKPEYLALNPNGKVPVLVDEDFVLYESHAIMAYLADKVGSSLYPKDLRARADVNKWLFWSSSHWGQAIATINFERMVKKFLGQEADPAQIARGEAMFHDHAKILDAHLATRAWISGDDVTLADLSIGGMLVVAVPAQLPLTPYTNIQKWFARVRELDAWKKAEG